MKIKGNSMDTEVKNGKSFIYSVHTCDVINSIRLKLSQPQVTCKEKSVIDAALN